MTAHDPSGWTNYCQACGRAYWLAWPRGKRMDYVDRERPHVCEVKP